MQIYLLLADVTQYQHLAMLEERDWLAFPDFVGGPLGDVWTPFSVTILRDEDLNKGLLSGDFPYLSANAPVFSRRAIGALSGLLVGTGEFLPLVCEEGDYHVFNVTRLVDALDESRSELRRFRSGAIAEILRHEFFPDRLRDLVIFKLSQFARVDVYVTDVFRQRVEEADLKGFVFRPVWPTPEQ